MYYTNNVHIVNTSRRSITCKHNITTTSVEYHIVQLFIKTNVPLQLMPIRIRTGRLHEMYGEALATTIQLRRDCFGCGATRENRLNLSTYISFPSTCSSQNQFHIFQYTIIESVGIVMFPVNRWYDDGQNKSSGSG